MSLIKGGYVYILSSDNRTTLYTGVTANLKARIYQHRSQQDSQSFTAQYRCIRLVYYKHYETIEAAIAEEKRIKGGSRAKKEKLIRDMNYEWRDLWEEVEREL